MQNDWKEIAKRNPKGFVCIQTAGDVIVCGPINKITVTILIEETERMKELSEVSISVDWFVYGKGIDIGKIPAKDWVISFDKLFTLTRFLNGSVPFEIQPTNERGDCVEFSDLKDEKNIRKRVLYFDCSEVLPFPLVEITGFRERILEGRSMS